MPPRPEYISHKPARSVSLPTQALDAEAASKLHDLCEWGECDESAILTAEIVAFAVKRKWSLANDQRKNRLALPKEVRAPKALSAAERGNIARKVAALAEK